MVQQSRLTKPPLPVRPAARCWRDQDKEATSVISELTFQLLGVSGGASLSVGKNQNRESEDLGSGLILVNLG